MARHSFWKGLLSTFTRTTPEGADRPPEPPVGAQSGPPGGEPGGTTSTSATAFRAERGYDLETAIQLTEEEARVGTSNLIEFDRASPCDACKGAGELWTGILTKRKGQCGRCAGSGAVRVTRVVNVRIPPGVRGGQGIRIRGEGEPGRDGAPSGDLHVWLVVGDPQPT